MERLPKFVHLPLVWRGLLGSVFVEHVRQNGRGVILRDELFLVDALHQLAAEAIDGFALLVHHIVILKNVFARLKVLGLDGLLRGFDAVGDHAALDGDAFFHAEREQQSLGALAGEDAHQVVFKRKIEAAGTRVALASGASPQLVVDAPALVAFGADNVQSAGLGDLVVLGLGGSLVGGNGCVPRIFGALKLLAGVVEARHAVRCDGMNLTLGRRNGPGLLLADEILPRHEVGVAAKQDVRAATCHVGGDRDHA